MRKLEYPVWSRGVTPITGKFRFEALEINGPVVCAGVSVHPGDLVVADDTGVVIIPQKASSEVIRRAIEASKKEERLIQVIEGGSSVEEMKKVLRRRNGKNRRKARGARLKNKAHGTRPKVCGKGYSFFCLAP